MSSDHIICYDIACPRRLGRIHRQLKKWAIPLQYSVFLFSGNERALAHLLTQLQTLIDPRHDDLRAYPLPKRGLRISFGRPTLPEGIYSPCLTLPAPASAPLPTPNNPSTVSTIGPPASPAWAIT